MKQQNSKLKELNRTNQIAGIVRTVHLYPNIPTPECMFIPKEDKLNLLLTWTIRPCEISKTGSLVSLKRKFTSNIPLNKNFCSSEYRVIKNGNKNLFRMEIHCYDERYGIALYTFLKNNIFEKH